MSEAESMCFAISASSGSSVSKDGHSKTAQNRSLSSGLICFSFGGNFRDKAVKVINA